MVLVQGAGTEHEVRSAGHDGCDHLWDLLRALAAVRGDEHGEAGIRRDGGNAREAGSAVTAPGLAHDTGSRLPRDGGRPVGGGVVDDDHFVDDVARHAPNEVADRRGLVERRYDQDDLHSASTPARSRRSPTDNGRSFRATAKPNGATSTSRAHHGMAHGSERKNVYAKRSEEHTSELQSPYELVCRLLLEKKKQKH